MGFLNLVSAFRLVGTTAVHNDPDSVTTLSDTIYSLLYLKLSSEPFRFICRSVLPRRHRAPSGYGLVPWGPAVRRAGAGAVETAVLVTCRPGRIGLAQPSAVIGLGRTRIRLAIKSALDQPRICSQMDG